MHVGQWNDATEGDGGSAKAKVEKLDLGKVLQTAECAASWDHGIIQILLETLRLLAKPSVFTCSEGNCFNIEIGWDGCCSLCAVAKLSYFNTLPNRS